MKRVEAFWDSSALAPLCVQQAGSSAARRALESRSIAVWRGTVVEMTSAFCRLRREGIISPRGLQEALNALQGLRESWVEVLRSEQVRELAQALLQRRALRAADALQLAAALVWCGARLRQRMVICLDRRLGEAAQAEGFQLERW